MNIIKKDNLHLQRKNDPKNNRTILIVTLQIFMAIEYPGDRKKRENDIRGSIGITMSLP